MVAVVAVLALLGGLTAWVASTGVEKQQSGSSRGCETRIDGDTGSASVDDPAPDFRARTLDGRCISLSSFDGQPVVVNFWASWCNPCRREFPLLQDALDDHRAEGLEILGIVYNDITADARAFAREQDADWPMLLDPDGDVARVYGVRGIPQTFLVRPDGTIAARIFGITSADDLARALRKILPR